MKRFALALAALSLLGASAAQADHYRPAGPQLRHATAPHVIVKKTDIHRHAMRPHWKVGKRVPAWQRKAVRDHHRYGLYRPGRGQQWIRIGNEFLLIKITNGGIIKVIVR